ncbi:hypothetical protein [Novosphingobium decolorationis]|uniref:Uncharacterized protein n=1 Tax=Novosphingobium decolorationis TaxID=2698673 RepID=A0ABX8E2T1_9SPHN|nr:hypothetical protein [Novosphingobium decolorationis]QVM83439.1 hypothetical protein HT578_06835 [Novosphingobium decolorationis]
MSYKSTEKVSNHSTFMAGFDMDAKSVGIGAKISNDYIGTKNTLCSFSDKRCLLGREFAGLLRRCRRVGGLAGGMANT